MPRYEFVFRLSPRGVFGLSQPGWTVVPVGDTDVVGPTIDTATGNILGAGSESVLREYDQRLRARIDIQGGSISFSDDIMTLAIDAEKPEAALNPAIGLLNRLLPLLSFRLGSLISAEFIQATDESGARVKYLLETKLDLLGYDLKQVADAVAKLPADLARLESEALLAAALNYFAKGLALIEIGAHGDFKTVSPVRPTGQLPLLAPEAFLNFWKVLEVVLGATPDSAGFKRRSDQLGLDRSYVDTVIVPLYKLRDAADVAHAERAADPVRFDDVGKAKQAAGTVIGALISSR